MARTLNEVIASLPRDQQQDIEMRAVRLIKKEKAQRLMAANSSDRPARPTAD